MNRRKFIKQSGAAMSVTLLPISSFSMMTAKTKYKMGLQLFTIRDAMEKDPIGSLKIAKSLGYQDFETYGYDGTNGTYYGFKAAEFKQILDDLGLSTSSGHYSLFEYLNAPIDQLNRYVDRCIEGAHATDQSYITWPWLDPNSRTLDKFKLLSERLNSIGERVNKAGLGFAYHNHDFEFIDQGGQNGYDIILKETDPSLVKLQMDMYWVSHSSKESPAALIAKQPERYVMWHIKDMDKVTRDYTELGNGSIDYDAVLKAASQEGLEYYFIEQGGNFAKDSIQSITDSALYFKKHLQKYL